MRAYYLMVPMVIMNNISNHIIYIYLYIIYAYIDIYIYTYTFIISKP